ncbi:glycosyltransferase family 2 protein [Paenibacillus mucilaginosus]|uniref:glycosyltransferase family 2 protein n=1 Tax=Paenibacillus mucilaginosus TaxID=61624 RepID=UPI00059FEC6C|nr:glycosyltransferase [Paenibacillus mucilaginosus]MCG7213038.1 glycosyltransferase [Paenibacillus mucilaginosus]WDM26556.1 glycosyltransferase [Paenibacillus mucilaginosus]
MKKRRRLRRHAAHRNPVSPQVSVIIPVLNERRTLARVIRQAYRVHPQTEVIVVSNGTVDGSNRTAARLGARVISYKQALGHDVGRSIGAKAAQGSVLLFLDGDMVIPAAKLRPYVQAVQQGVDVALNRYSGPAKSKRTHRVVLAKYALNVLLNKGELEGASMTTVPHAISRKALETIGAEALAVPPKAQAIASARGLRIKAVHLLSVGRLNPIRRSRKGGDPVGDLIIGDHLEAVEWLTRETGARGLRTDLGRKREFVR